MKGRGSQVKTQMTTVITNNRGGFFALRNTNGYTIVEVLIFLAVTTLLFVMIATTFAGRQARTEFSVAAREMEARLQDITNDVSTGYYNNPGNFRCTTTGGVPTITAVTQEQGTNQDCIFIGRAVQFDLANGDGGNNGLNYNLYSIVGARQTAAGDDVTSYTEANPRTITNPPQAVDLTENNKLPAGLKFARMHMRRNGTFTQIRGVAFYSTFGDQSAESGSLSVNIVPLGLLTTNNSKAGVVSSVAATAAFEAFSNPDDGIYICFDGDNSNQHAEFRLGGNNARLTTDMSIEEGSCGSPSA